MMLAGVPVAAPAAADLARSSGPPAPTGWPTGSTALADDMRLLALTLDERVLILNALDDPPDGLGELRRPPHERARAAAARRSRLAAPIDPFVS